MSIIKFIRTLLIIFLLGSFSTLKADVKKNIIENINTSETLKFNFIQLTNNKEENGVCFLKRPHYLKCIYKDKNLKELIVNKKQLVIYHKRYEKIYNYPLSKSFFSEILNRKKFSDMITQGTLIEKDDIFLVKCYIEEKGEIVFYFNNKNFDLKGWDLISLNYSKINFKISNSIKGFEIKKKFFDIPDLN